MSTDKQNKRKNSKLRKFSTFSHLQSRVSFNARYALKSAKQMIDIVTYFRRVAWRWNSILIVMNSPTKTEVEGKRLRRTARQQDFSPVKS